MCHKSSSIYGSEIRGRATSRNADEEKACLRRNKQQKVNKQVCGQTLSEQTDRPVNKLMNHQTNENSASQ